MLWHACFGLALTVMALQGQTISFFRQFETPGMDRATAVAADGSGIYVIGNRGFSQGGGVRKYDSRGNELWTREFSVPAESVHFAGAAADATGVYLAGYIRPHHWFPLDGVSGDDGAAIGQRRMPATIQHAGGAPAQAISKSLPQGGWSWC